MSGTRVMTLGAIPAGSFPGSGGPIPSPYTAPYGRGPEWTTNFITNPVVDRELPQNRLRVWNGGVISNLPVGFNSGLPIAGSILNGLGKIASFAFTPSPIVVSKNNRLPFPGGYRNFAGLGDCGCGCNGRPGGCGGNLRGLGQTEVFSESQVFDESLPPVVPAPPPRPDVVDINASSQLDQANLRSNLLWMSASFTGALIGAYHGYHRNRNSTGWSVAWAIFGLTFPLLTAGVAVVQGVGKPKG